MKKVEMRLELPDDKDKKEAGKIDFELSGIDSIAMDTNRKLTLNGNKNPVTVVARLSKVCCTGMVAVGPTKKVEMQLELPDDKDKKEARKIDFELSGIDSIAMDTNRKLTLKGNTNSVTVVARLSKVICTEIRAS